MAKMRVLFDTNVVLDVIFKRKDFYAAAAHVMTKAAAGDIEAYLAAHAVTTIYYLVARSAGKEAAQVALVDVLRITRVAAVDQEVIDQALKNPQRDFEDAVTMMAAVHADADYIVTRNAADFRPGPLPILTPTELLAYL